MTHWFEMYLVAALGSFIARLLWWMQEHKWSEISQELRVGWWRYLKEDLWAGLSLAARMLSGNQRLECREKAMESLLHQAAAEMGYSSYWEVPAPIRWEAQSMAKEQLEGSLVGFDDVVRTLESSQKVAQKATAGAFILGLLASPVKMLMTVACAEGNVTSTVTVAGPIDDDKSLGITWWDRPNGPRWDARLGLSGQPGNPFIQLRSDEGGARLGVGLAPSWELGDNLSFGVMFRAFTDGTRGSPAQANVMPSLSYSASSRLSLCLAAFGVFPEGSKQSWSYFGTATYKLSRRDSICVEAYNDGTYQLDFAHCVAGW